MRWRPGNLINWVGWAGCFSWMWIFLGQEVLFCLGCVFNCNCIAGLPSAMLRGEQDCGRMNNGTSFGLKVLILLSFQFLKRVFFFYLLSHVCILGSQHSNLFCLCGHLQSVMCVCFLHLFNIVTVELKMAQLARCILCKHEELRLRCLAPRCLYWMLVIPVLGMLRLVDLSHSSQTGKLQVQWDLHQDLKWRMREEGSQHWPQPSQAWVRMCTHNQTWANIQTIRCETMLPL